VSALQQAQQSVDAATAHVALAAAAEEAVDALLGMSEMFHTSTFTCSEIDALGNLVALVRDEETAREFVFSHAQQDEPGDRHYGMAEEDDRDYVHPAHEPGEPLADDGEGV
jgi:hypothetical protein